jgi:hypothetical protein
MSFRTVSTMPNMASPEAPPDRPPTEKIRVAVAGCLLAVAAALLSGPVAAADDAVARGWEHLRQRAYLPPDFDQEVFEALPEVWEQPSRDRAAAASPHERRRMAFRRYGLTPDPRDPTRPLQYVAGADGSWTMSCLACHQGQVGGRSIPGLPNSNYALETLTEEVRLVKVRQRKAFGHMDYGSLLLPLGTTVGTTNAVIFGVALMQHRDRDLQIVSRPPRFDMAHHDMDAPPWWHYAKKRQLYADGFAPKGHRMLMQFLLVKENGPQRFREWEDEFREIEAWIESLQPPAWPGTIDRGLANRGRGLFREHCGSCHGEYARRGSAGRDTYPARIVPIDEIGTDRLRFDSLTPANRRDLNESWFGHYGEAGGIDQPEGYLAPPLDGIWATAPYLHNGSVPTLWHLLHPGKRPTVWKRSPEGYDDERVGLEIESFTKLPSGVKRASQRRWYFDTTRPGKGAAGHDYPDVLDEDDKRAVLEYLKTL